MIIPPHQLSILPLLTVCLIFSGTCYDTDCCIITRADELLDWQGSGMSVMEVSHRSKEYIAITEKAESKLRSFMEIPDNYKVLFLQGGASLQFSAIPLNLLNGGRADYLTTGAS